MGANFAICTFKMALLHLGPSGNGKIIAYLCNHGLWSASKNCSYKVATYIPKRHENFSALIIDVVLQWKRGNVVTVVMVKAGTVLSAILVKPFKMIPFF